MTKTVTDVTRALQEVFTQAADVAARATGFVQRESKLTGNLFVQTLTFGWLSNPNATLEDLAQTAAALGLTISPQGLDQRFGPRAADFLLTMLENAVARVLSTDAVSVSLLQRFPAGISLLDSTTLKLPEALAERWMGCGGTTLADGQAAVKLHVRFNLLNGALEGPILSSGRHPDARSSLQAAPLPERALRLADLAYFSLERFKSLGEQGVYWLTRVPPALCYFDAEGRCWKLANLLAKQSADTVDQPIEVGAEQRLPCRLLAIRVPPHVAQKRRERLEEKRRRKGRKYRDADSWALTEWTVYLTNASVALLSVTEALILARCRWQIELLFKLWKSEGRIDESRSGKSWRILCEVYAKLLGMVVQHWLLLVGCWRHADRSLTKASRTVRAHALALAVVLGHGHLVCKTLRVVQQCLQRGCRVNKRRRYPSHFQLLRNLPKAG